MFKENSKAIYLQIADRICDSVLSGELKAGDRLPSVREYAMTVQVNPNTVMRTYEWLSQREIIFNRRGIGFFLSENARETIAEHRRDEFLGSEIFETFRQLRLLDVSPETLIKKYQEYLSK